VPGQPDLFGIDGNHTFLEWFALGGWIGDWVKKTPPVAGFLILQS
jgi:hypothetical protein